MVDRRDDDVRSDGFLSRWARRKAQVQNAPEAAGSNTPEALEAPTPPRVAPSAPHAPGAASVGEASLSEAPQPAVVSLSMDDVDKLTPESDYAAFASKTTDPAVRNAAMKKLFTDPHYNVMDGLDVYIDDYNTSIPIPKSVLRQMVQARFLGLIDDEVVDQPKPDFIESDADNPNAVAAVEPPPDEVPLALDVADPRTHENAHLQLQSDDATGSDGPRAGAETGADAPLVPGNLSQP